MSLSDLVTVSISLTGANISRAGFGTPLIAAYHANFGTRTKSYDAETGLADMVIDGFAVTDPAYLAAQSLLAQNPKVESFKIGRRALPWTIEYDVIVKTALSSTKYTVTVDGQDAEFTSDATATKPEITAGMKIAIEALGLAVTVADDLSDTLTITGNVAGAWHTVTVDDAAESGAMWIENTTADPGIVTDIAAIVIEDDDWYGFLLDSNSPAEIAAAAADMETRTKLFVANVSDTEILDSGTSDDIASTLKASAYARIPLIYHPEDGEFAAAAWMGKMLPKDPGSSTWKFKTLAGVPTYKLRASEKTQLEAKLCNYYIATNAVNHTRTGITPANEWIDVIRGIDWLRVRIQEDEFTQLVGVDKIPYTDDGAAIIEAALQGRLQDAIAKNVLASSPAPVVTVPRVSDQNVSDRAARYFPGIRFTAYLAGAIHKLQIIGSVSP